MTDSDILHIRDSLRIERLQRLAANMRRTGSANGATRAAAERDAARRAAVLELARRQFGTRGPEGE